MADESVVACVRERDWEMPKSWISVGLSVMAVAAALGCGATADTDSATAETLASAQVGRPVSEPRRIPGAPVCEKCPLRFDTVFVVDGEDGPQSIGGMPRAVARDGLGQLYVVSDALPRVFDADGQFVRDLGRFGAGPGEFRSISAAAMVAPDTVVFFDVGLSRLTYYHADGRYLRSVPSGPGIAFSLDPLPRGELLVVGGMSGKEPLLEAHIIDPNGRVRASFAPGVSTQEQRKTATADARGVIVVADAFTHSFDHFSSDGILRGRFVIAADWFEPTTERPIVAPGGPPPRVLVQRVWLDPKGRLWVFSLVPRPDWERALRPSSGAGGRRYAFNPVMAMQTRVEVVDMPAGRVLVSAVTPYFQMKPVGEGYFTAYAETSEGLPMLLMLRVDLDTVAIR